MQKNPTETTIKILSSPSHWSVQKIDYLQQFEIPKSNLTIRKYCFNNYLS